MLLPHLALLGSLVLPPSTIVERTVTAGDVYRRLSVFRDGTAVLVVENEDGERDQHRRRLQPLELRVLSQVIDECYDEVVRQGSAREAVGGAWQVLSLAPAGREPVVLRLSLLGAPSAQAARLGQALDEVENLLTSLPTPAEDFSAWQPQEGERVELADGTIITVRSVLAGMEGPVIEVELGNDQGTAVMALAELRRLANRRVEP